MNYLILFSKKKTAWKHAKKTKDPQDIAHAKYLRNHAKSQIRRAKSSYVQDYLVYDNISVKKFWEKINYVMPTNSSSDKINLVDKHTKEHVKDIDTADYVNLFFASIGAILARNFDQDWTDNITTNSDVWLEDVHVLLLPIIMNIDTCKSSSIENLSARVLKDAFLMIIIQLVHMYNLSSRSCTFPDS